MTHSSAPASVADVQRYWDARPCNLWHSPEPVGSREYFDEVEYRYATEPYFQWMPDRLFRSFERRFGWHLLITAEAV